MNRVSLTIEHHQQRPAGRGSPRHPGVAGIVAVVVCLLLVTVGCGRTPDPIDPPPSGPPADSLGSADSAAKYAPYVWLDVNEKYNPEDTATFILSSKLQLTYGCQASGPAGYAAPKTVTHDVTSAAPDPVQLGDNASQPYSFSVDPVADGCIDESPKLTVPSNARVDKRLTKSTFALALTNADVFSGVDVSTTPVTVWWQFVPSKDDGGGAYVYWFFYGGDNFVDASNQQINAHEGDWEHIAVRVDHTDTPVSVTFHAHTADSCAMTWSDVEHEGKRPVVYSGKGSHASFPYAGQYNAMSNRGTGGAGSRSGGALIDVTSQGTKWDTAEMLVELSKDAAPWWGYYGKWGNATAPDPDAVKLTGVIASHNPEGSAGPTGPTPDNAKVNSHGGEFPTKGCAYWLLGKSSDEDQGTNSSSPSPKTSAPGGPGSGGAESAPSSDPGGQSQPESFPAVGADGPISGSTDVSTEDSLPASIVTSLTAIPLGDQSGWIDLSTSTTNSNVVCLGSFDITSQTVDVGTVTINATLDPDAVIYDPCPQSLTLKYTVADPQYDVPALLTYSDSSGGTGTLSAY